MPLRVAFDMDGTLADMHRVLRDEAVRLFGDTPPSPQGAEPQVAADEAKRGAVIGAEFKLSRAQHTQLWEHVRGIENFWNELPEIEPGIVARLAALASEHRWDVVFLTTRPVVAGQTVQRQTQRWLVAHGFALPSVFVVQRSRGRIAEALELDAVVDDRPENCLDVALDSKATAILIWPAGSDRVPLGVDRLSVRVVPTISDALHALIKIDRLRQPGVARTLRKLFRKESTA
jgi:hypothetical protein